MCGEGFSHSALGQNTFARRQAIFYCADALMPLCSSVGRCTRTVTPPWVGLLSAPPPPPPPVLSGQPTAMHRPLLGLQGARKRAGGWLSIGPSGGRPFRVRPGGRWIGFALCSSRRGPRPDRAQAPLQLRCHCRHSQPPSTVVASSQGPKPHMATPPPSMAPVDSRPGSPGCAPSGPSSKPTLGPWHPPSPHHMPPPPLPPLAPQVLTGTTMTQLLDRHGTVVGIEVRTPWVCNVCLDVCMDGSWG